MRTALITIGDVDAGAYPIALVVDEGGHGWDPQPIASDRLVLPDGFDCDALRRRILNEPGEAPTFRDDGRLLHEVLTTNTVGAAWLECRGPGQDPLRTLLDIEPEALRALPWELLWSPKEQNWLLPDAGSPLSRVRRFAPGTPDEDWWPLLRVLVVVAIPDAEAREELIGIHDGFAHVSGLVDLDVLRRPTEKRLAEVFEHLRPHVLYFIGHGEPDRLLFDPPEGHDDGWPWDGESISTLLRAHPPRLVVLDACRTTGGAPTLDQQLGVLGIADRMSAAGVNAVVAMQADVRDDAVADFSAEMWRRLGKGADIDVAVAHARSRMKMTVGSWTRRDPWLPALTLSVMPGRVLPALYPVPDERRSPIEETIGYHRTRHFVDRGAPRRVLWQDVVDAGQDRADGIIVTGRPQDGKTAFAQWCAGACAVRGYDAAYLDLKGHAGNSLDLLGAIAEELCRGSGGAAEMVAAFDEYVDIVDELQHATTPVPRPSWSEGRYRRTQSRDASDADIDTMYTAFRRALATLADEGCVLVALDDVPAQLEGHWRLFVRHFLGRLRDARTVCVVTALDAASAAASLGGDLARRFRTVELAQVERAEVPQLLAQFLRAEGFVRDGIGSFLDWYLAELPDDFTCSEFELAAQLAPRRGLTREDSVS